MCATPPTCIHHHHHHYLWVNMMTPVLTLNFTGGGDDDERQSMKWILHPQKGFFCPRERKKSDWILICWVREAKSFSSSKYEILVSPSARYSIEGGKKKVVSYTMAPSFFLFFLLAVNYTQKFKSAELHTFFPHPLPPRMSRHKRARRNRERERDLYVCLTGWKDTASVRRNTCFYQRLSTRHIPPPPPPRGFGVS